MSYVPILNSDRGFVVNDVGEVLVQHSGTNETVFAPAEAREIDINTENISKTEGHCSWTEDQTKCLLNLIAEMPYTKGKYKTKGERWRLISEKIMQLDMGKFTAEQCRNRYNTLVSAMKRIKNNVRKTSRTRMKGTLTADQCCDRYNTLIPAKKRVKDNARKRGLNRMRVKESSTVQKMLEELVGHENSVVLPNVLTSDNSDDGITPAAVHFLSRETEDQETDSIPSPSSSYMPTLGIHVPTTSQRNDAIVTELKCWREQRRQIADRKDQLLQRLCELLEGHNTLLRELLQKQ